MRNHNVTLAAALALVAAPLVLTVVAAVSFHVRNQSSGFIVASGETREYVLYVPVSYNRTRPTPLVITMHGAGLWGAAQRDISLWNRVADREGFIVVYPSGVTGDGPRIWRVGPGPGLERDVRFIADLIDTLSAAYNIDPTRIYANGLSNGGGMSFALSCALPDRIAAIGVVSSAQTLDWRWCTDRRALPMIAFHGTADTAAPYHGGPSRISSRGFPDIQGWTSNWAQRNQCGAEPIDTPVTANVTRRTYSNCEAPVVLYTIHGGGHDWPGGLRLPTWCCGPASTGVDATSEMWAFFRAHSLVR